VSARPRMPLVTLLLIAACLFAAFAVVIDPDLVQEYGFRSNYPSIAKAFTSLFLHANLFHLLGNMVFLAAVGAAVELATGSLRFVIVYFVGGLTGTAVHFAMTRHAVDPAPLIGASGCIASCAAYYSVRYTRLRVPVAPKLAISVAAVTGLWLVLQILGAFVKLGDQGGTSFWTHIGGFCAGAFLSLVFRAPDFEQLKLGHEVLERMNSRGPAAVAFAAGQHLKQHPKDTKVLWELADAQSALGEGPSEAKTVLQLIDLTSEDERIEAIRRLCKIGRVSALTTLKRLQFADQCRPTAPEVSRALLRSVVEGPADEIQRPDALLALIALERDDHPDRATQLLVELMNAYPIHPAAELARKRGWVL
jgi:membrane associated rhomboid family serine protease